MSEDKKEIKITAEDYVDSYQRWVDDQVWKSVRGNHDWAVLGLVNEAGEVAQLREKFIRKGNISHDEYQARLKDELGDVLWNVANLCNISNLSLHDVMVFNIQKLEERKQMMQVLAEQGTDTQYSIKLDPGVDGNGPEESKD